MTDLVEEAVLAEFDRITDRGGVLGAMERMYQRNKIQEESLYYETLKHTGELPLIGVNTFLNKKGSAHHFTRRSDPQYNRRKRTADPEPPRVPEKERRKKRRVLKTLETGRHQQ
jgi:methylmalonyl-CoA mutase N-terminal domain/subunit